ncbi:hypothetical protein EXIGLDRAFT_648125 [Exidia glandulosa HHB12029]|uniref:HAD-like protein n=1 Tax=Exidia glandulosa HHB12029 TaxID=1314781 RepID=A0A166AG23_EXIGL|nr:hypothetical protein EXIGLDRAFT_648125 [Exidia glandulosa HHB12029]
MAATNVALPRPEDVELIVCDVDGTLLTDAHVVHPTTQRAFAALRALRPDLPIVIASGKQYSSCTDVREALGLEPTFPAIHGHGALLHGDHGELIASHPLAPHAILHIADQMRGRGTFVFTPDAVVLINAEAGKDWATVARKYDKHVIDASGPSERTEFLRRIETGEQPIVKITVCTDTAETEAVFAQLEGHQRELVSSSDTSKSEPPFHITRAIPWIIELVPPGVDKARAVRELCATRGLDMSKVLAFGDGDNDAKMLESVGHGVAMGNGMPEPKRRAKYVTVTNNEGGVGVFISSIFGFET